jgi:hypothetical protein
MISLSSLELSFNILDFLHFFTEQKKLCETGTKRKGNCFSTIFCEKYLNCSRSFSFLVFKFFEDKSTNLLTLRLIWVQNARLSAIRCQHYSMSVFMTTHHFISGLRSEVLFCFDKSNREFKIVSTSRLGYKLAPQIFTLNNFYSNKRH